MRLRWGIAGSGNISGDFVRALLINPSHHKVVAVGASSQLRAEEFIAKNDFPYESPKPYGSYSDLVKDESIDVLYVGLLNHMHKAVVLNAIANGKHVLCEKPLGLNEVQVREMIEAAKKANVLLVEAFWTKFFPAWRHVKEGVLAQEFGDVKLVTAKIAFSKHAANKMELHYGGGDLMATGCYTVMAAMWMYNEKPSKIEVTGVQLHEGVDASGTVVLHFSKNRIAHLMYTGEVDASCEAEVCCENGRYLIPQQMWSPSKLVIIPSDPKIPREEKDFDLPVKDNSAFRYPDASGLLWEANHVRDCLVKKLTESPDITHQNMIEMAQVLEEIRRQCGVEYPAAIL